MNDETKRNLFGSGRSPLVDEFRFDKHGIIVESNDQILIEDNAVGEIDASIHFVVDVFSIVVVQNAEYAQ